MANLAAFGYRPKTYRDLCTPHGYLSGTDAERAGELNQAFADPETTMVLAARGGYGCGRILDQLDYSLLTARPKIVCGYSDLTALHAAIQRRCRLVSFHGPNLVGGLGGDDSCEVERVATLAMLQGESSGPLMTGSRAIRRGVAEGPLVGGNLAVLTAMVGAPDEPDFEGALLCLEDTGEAPYRVDRLLTQLRASGRLDRVAGVVLGYFSDAGPDISPPIDAVVEELLAPLGVPVLAGCLFGHEHPNLPLPMGAMARLDTGSLRLEVLQSVVAA
jgi:muramoyltetrapeptide carboxypeptidase